MVRAKPVALWERVIATGFALKIREKNVFLGATQKSKADSFFYFCALCGASFYCCYLLIQMKTTVGQWHGLSPLGAHAARVRRFRRWPMTK